MKQNVLFICTHNSARSQIAEAFLNKLYPEKFEAFSAGIEPSVINPYVVKVMTEIGFDLSKKEKTIEKAGGAGGHQRIHGTIYPVYRAFSSRIERGQAQGRSFCFFHRADQDHAVRS